MPEPVAGPVLFARGADSAGIRLAALLVFPEKDEPPDLRPEGGRDVAPENLARVDGKAVWRYCFSLPVREEAHYELAGAVYPVATRLDSNLRVAFVSCNGQEAGDTRRDASERNRLWRELVTEHGRRRFQLLLHGGTSSTPTRCLTRTPAFGPGRKRRPVARRPCPGARSTARRPPDSWPDATSSSIPSRRRPISWHGFPHS